jgi:hypothetical protein
MVETLRSGLKIEWLGIRGNGTIHHYSYSCPTNVQGKELYKENGEEKQIHFGVLVKIYSFIAFWEGLNWIFLIKNLTALIMKRFYFFMGLLCPPPSVCASESYGDY